MAREPRPCVRCCEALARVKYCERCAKEVERERAVKSSRAYRRRHLKETREYARAYNKAHLADRRARQKKWYYKDILKARAIARAWKLRNPDAVKALGRRRVARDRARRAAAARDTVLANLAAIRALVPRGLLVLDDVVQDIALAILEGRTTVAKLQADKKALAGFVQGQRRVNFERKSYRFDEARDSL